MIQVDQLVKAMIFHERRQTEARSKLTPEQRAKTPKFDYLRPIIADGDTGFGGVTSVMKLAKLFIESGAGGNYFLPFLRKREMEKWSNFF